MPSWLTRIYLDHIRFLDRSIAATMDEIAASLDAIPRRAGLRPMLLPVLKPRSRLVAGSLGQSQRLSCQK
jgi:hypothetical protein